MLRLKNVAVEKRGQKNEPRSKESLKPFCHLNFRGVLECTRRARPTCEKKLTLKACQQL